MTVDELANEIRRVDGDHTLGAGAKCPCFSSNPCSFMLAASPYAPEGTNHE